MFFRKTIAVLRSIAQEIKMANEQLERLTDEVAEARSVVQGAVTLLGNLSQQIRDNVTDPAALTALADDLDASTNALAEAVVANTPGVPEPTDPQS